jgi:hypothetical protein
MHTKIKTAESGSILKVRVVINATPMVAVSPGSIPTMIPNWVAPSTYKIITGFCITNPHKALENIKKPSIMVYPIKSTLSR